MKRIQTACLNQTIHFRPKDDISQTSAAQDAQAEYDEYLKGLNMSGTKYKITDESIQTDGSVIIKLKRQLNQYDIGDYLK